MKPNSTCKRIWLWILDGEKNYLALATYNILIASSTNKPLQILKAEFDKYFTYTVKQGSELTFLNYRIIQSEHGISIDQLNHIDQTILKPNFKDIIDKDEKPKFQSAPFPLNPKFEVELFQANPMDEKQIASIKIKYKGAYNHWTGALQYIAVMSRIYSAYAIMRLSGYNSAPSLPCYTALHHFM